MWGEAGEMFWLPWQILGCTHVRKNATNQFLFGSFVQKKKTRKCISFQTHFKSGYFNSDKRHDETKSNRRASSLSRSLARLLAAKISSLARTHARKEAWLPSQIAVQRSTKHGWAREKLIYTDPTALQIQRWLLHFPFTSTVTIENTCISFNIPPPRGRAHGVPAQEPRR